MVTCNGSPYKDAKIKIYELDTFPCSLFNLFGLWTIYMATPKRLNYYVYYLLGYQLCCIVFDFGGAIIAFPVFSFPAKCAFIIGMASWIGVSTELQATAAVIITLSMLSILGIAIFQRQQSILPTDHILSFSMKLSIFVHFFILGHPLFITFFVVYFFFTTDSDLGTRQALQKYPELEQFLLQPSSICADSSFGENVATLPLIYLAVIIIVGLYLVAPAYLSLYAQRKIMSAKTLALQKKWLRNLNIQVFLFSLVIMVPVLWWIAVYQLSLINLTAEKNGDYREEFNCFRDPATKEISFVFDKLSQ
ncbi:unnamed protein product, partial [Mesorhabditis belari]|uniref:Uncharacterized protein n=1 Tax=Mesorhabditis belari TaxID=2138241 RepID=A0AAF3EDN8_9BILA